MPCRLRVVVRRSLVVESSALVMSRKATFSPRLGRFLRVPCVCSSLLVRSSASLAGDTALFFFVHCCEATSICCHVHTSFAFDGGRATETSRARRHRRLLASLVEAPPPRVSCK